uniref:N6-adenine-specific methylase n=1 Tax=uncultured Chloroflexota bacterium TaxID=166587 RepID=H5SDY0_9CHLR|nr:N6-adenine-specific methylase [uncultured Chloroflexota bacterium]
MRVISGSAKGRKLKPVPGDTTRPITDRVKEALFNILGGDVIGSTWWDVFAGTGGVGIEALSRGALFCRFTDAHPLAIRTIRANLEATGLAERAEVRRGDAFALLHAPADRTFDYLYIAPPQYHELWSKALLALEANPSWLSESAWVIVQIHPREATPLSLQQLSLFDQRRYGSTLLLFFEHAGKES